MTDSTIGTGTSYESINAEHEGALDIRLGKVLLSRTPESIARSLRYALAGWSNNTRRIVGVTSARHGEGTTLMSQSIAAIIAQDRQLAVCWLDLNWWKGETSPDHLFAHTIAGYVSGTCEMNELAERTSVPGLSLIAAGHLPASARSTVAHSDQLATLVHDLATMFDHIVVDLPPVLTTADSITLGQLTEGYHFVVGRRMTPIKDVQACVHDMEPTPCLGVILNESSRRSRPKSSRRRRG